MDPFFHPRLHLDHFQCRVRFPIRDCANLPADHANERKHAHHCAIKAVRRRRDHGRRNNDPSAFLHIADGKTGAKKKGLLVASVTSFAN
jgi:hypothetical protein